MRFSHLLPESRSDPSWNWHLDIEVCDFNRLPWFHRASPSTTRDEFVDINECGYIDDSLPRCQHLFASSGITSFVRLALTCEVPSGQSALMEWVTTPEGWIALVTLTLLEIVLGIDNIVFISILAGKLPVEQQKRARQTGLSLALITRILLLCGLSFMAQLKTTLFTIRVFSLNHPVTLRDLVLFAGGLFLLAKSTREIHEKLEGEDGEATRKLAPTFTAVIIQILLLDIVFSLDSVITAIGMARHLVIMITAVILAMVFMLAFGGYISRFIEKHPTLKMLALSFLLMIGLVLVAESFHKEIPKGYVYFAMAFSVGVEMLNLKLRAKQKATRVELHQPYR